MSSKAFILKVSKYSIERGNDEMKRLLAILLVLLMVGCTPKTPPILTTSFGEGVSVIQIEALALKTINSKEKYKVEEIKQFSQYKEDRDLDGITKDLYTIEGKYDKPLNRKFRIIVQFLPGSQYKVIRYNNTPGD